MKLNRDDVYIIQKHSNWSADEVATIIKADIHKDAKSIYKFIELFFVGFGSAFLALGTIFFFAYNWDNLHNFAKFAIIELLLVTSIVLVFLPKLSEVVKNIMLTVASVLVGVMFAIYGQVYQTGADAYNLFLAWAVFISLWVIVARFAALWLIFIVLVNVTIYLYINKNFIYYQEDALYPILFNVNILFLIAILLLEKYQPALIIPKWLPYILAFSCACFATITIIANIFGIDKNFLWTLGAIVTVIAIIGIGFESFRRNVFYFAITIFSLIVICSALITKLADGSRGGGIVILLIMTIFVITSVTMLIKHLIKIHKDNSNEQTAY